MGIFLTSPQHACGPEDSSDDVPTSAQERTGCAGRDFQIHATTTVGSGCGNLIFFFCISLGKDAEETSSLHLLPWEASLVLLVPRGCPRGACQAPILVGRSQQGCPSHASSLCQRPVRLLVCLCGNGADTLNVVVKAVFSPSPTNILQGFPVGKL